MSRYDDYRSSTSTLDSLRYDASPLPRERQDRFHREPPVMERHPREDRFEARLKEMDRYGPPARHPGRHYDDDDEELVYPTPHERPRAVSPPPRLVRRQSSLDTFDRIPSRKMMDDYNYRPREPVTPSLRHSPPRRSDDVYYEDIHIAEPDYYGDEELRGFRDREPVRSSRHRRSSSRVSERLDEEPFEKPYPRKGKTRMPKKLVHPRAILDRHYPFEEQGDVVMIQVALSKDQIDELIYVSREIRDRNEGKPQPPPEDPCHVIVVGVTKLTVWLNTGPSLRTSPSPVRKTRRNTMDLLSVPTHSARSSRGSLYLERSPTRNRSHSRHHHHHHPHNGSIETTENRRRSVSIVSAHGRRRSSPGRSHHRHESDHVSTGPLAIMVRPRDSDEDIRLIEPADHHSGHHHHHGGGELIRIPDRDDYEIEEETIEKKDRKGRSSSVHSFPSAI